MFVFISFAGLLAIKECSWAFNELITLAFAATTEFAGIQRPFNNVLLIPIHTL